MDLQTLVVVLFVCFCLWQGQQNLKKLSEDEKTKSILAALWSRWMK